LEILELRLWGGQSERHRDERGTRKTCRVRGKKTLPRETTFKTVSFKLRVDVGTKRMAKVVNGKGLMARKAPPWGGPRSSGQQDKKE